MGHFGDHGSCARWKWGKMNINHEIDRGINRHVLCCCNPFNLFSLIFSVLILMPALPTCPCPDQIRPSLAHYLLLVFFSSWSYLYTIINSGRSFLRNWVGMRKEYAFFNNNLILHGFLVLLLLRIRSSKLMYQQTAAAYCLVLVFAW